MQYFESLHKLKFKIIEIALKEGKKYWNCFEKQTFIEWFFQIMVSKNFILNFTIKN
jgi:hypothetical protein